MDNMRELSMDEMSSINGGAGSGTDIDWGSLLPDICPKCGSKLFKSIIQIDYSRARLGECSVHTRCCGSEGKLYSNGLLNLW